MKYKIQSVFAGILILTCYCWVVENTPVQAQRMGGMGMGGMGGGSGRNKGSSSNHQNANDEPVQEREPNNPFALGHPVDAVPDRINYLEKFLFGKMQPHLSQEKRLERMEKKLVPYEHHAASEDVTKRVDHLWTLLQKANAKPADQTALRDD